MIEYFAQIYDRVMIASDYHEVFSLQVVISITYLLALFGSVFRAVNHNELFSNFLCISVVVTKYMLTALLMEHILLYIQENNRVDNAQDVYLGLCAFNMLSIFIVYRLHIRFSYKYGPLFFAVVRLTAVLALAHFILWFKFVVLNIQEGFAVLHYLYSFTVLYISGVLGVLMLLPRLVNTRAGRVLSLQLPRG
mgnify:CR=1 FL=1|tara:strand:- start:2958 stop:3536 length:579 start_codon:yes stop_codon:yes gene_type:complete